MFVHPTKFYSINKTCVARATLLGGHCHDATGGPWPVAIAGERRDVGDAASNEMAIVPVFSPLGSPALTFFHL